MNDGGSAFPRTRSTECLVNSTAQIESVGGMSLRDYFAGQALAGMCANPNEQTWPPTGEDCYRFADLLLAQRAVTAGREDAK